jgi:hypothetical protein
VFAPLEDFTGWASVTAGLVVREQWTQNRIFSSKLAAANHVRFAQLMILRVSITCKKLLGVRVV